MIHPRFHIQHKDSQRICSCTTNLQNGTKTSNQVNLIRTINTSMNMVHISFSQHCQKLYHSSNVHIGYYTCSAQCKLLMYSLQKITEAKLQDVFSEDLFLLVSRWVSSGKQNWMCRKNQKLLKKVDFAKGMEGLASVLQRDLTDWQKLQDSWPPLSESVGNTVLKEEGEINKTISRKRGKNVVMCEIFLSISPGKCGRLSNRCALWALNH